MVFHKEYEKPNNILQKKAGICENNFPNYITPN